MTVLSIALSALASVLLVLAVLAFFQKRIPATPTPLPARRTSDYDIAFRCFVYVAAVKLAVLLLAWIVVGGDMFRDAKWLFARGDAHHYLSIIENGYLTTGEESLYIVFFPLFPYFARGLFLLTGESFWTGSLLSMAALAAAGFELFKLTLEQAGEEAALRAMKYFFLFPTVFFAMLPYSEGLFLLLAVSSVRALLNRRFAAAGVLGLFAALTRSVGVYLAVPFAVALVRECYEGRLDGAFFKRLLKKGWPIVLIPLGTVIYLAVNALLFHDPFYFMAVQKNHWNQGFDFFPHTVYRIAKNIFDFDFVAYGLPLWIPELLFLIGMLPTLIRVARKSDRVLASYALTMYIGSFSLSWLLSAPRYMLALFPCFILWGTEDGKRKAAGIVRTVLLGASLLAMSLFYALGCPIY